MKVWVWCSLSLQNPDAKIIRFVKVNRKFLRSLVDVPVSLLPFNIWWHKPGHWLVALRAGLQWAMFWETQNLRNDVAHSWGIFSKFEKWCCTFVRHVCFKLPCSGSKFWAGSFHQRGDLWSEGHYSGIWICFHQEGQASLGDQNCGGQLCH